MDGRANVPGRGWLRRQLSLMDHPAHRRLEEGSAARRRSGRRFSTLRPMLVLDHAIIGNIADLPQINTSFNLSYSGHGLRRLGGRRRIACIWRIDSVAHVNGCDQAMSWDCATAIPEEVRRCPAASSRHHCQSAPDSALTSLFIFRESGPRQCVLDHRRLLLLINARAHRASGLRFFIPE